MISKVALLCILFVSFHAFVYGEEGFISNGYGISEKEKLPYKILKGLYQYANSNRESKEIEGIPEFIFENYISKMKKDWKIKYFEIEYSESTTNIQYILVSCVFSIGDLKIKRPSVFFFVKKEGVWSLFNFPYHSSGVPQWSPNIIPHLCESN